MSTDSPADAPELGLDAAAEERARRLHEEAIVIDACVPTTAYLDEPQYSDHLQQGGVTAANITAASRVSYPTATGKIDHIRQQVATSDEFRFATAAGDIRDAAATGQTAILLAFQDAMPIFPDDRMIHGEEFPYLRATYRLGVRTIQLTYNSLTYVGAGCTERRDPGLSHFGCDLVEELNRLGILIDLSHCGDRTTMDAIEQSSDPVVCTHAGARSISNLTRNKTDEQITAIAETGGLIGMTLFPPSVKSDPDTHEVQPATLADVLDQIDHLVDVAGVEHVGFGSDMNDKALDDGVTPPYAAYRNFRPEFPEAYGRGPIEEYEPYPRGVHRHTHLEHLTRGLVSRGYEDEEIRGILGENFLRVFETVHGEETAAEARTPNE